MKDNLRWYSRMFNTVEGNSTFYGLPSRETVKQWCDQSAEGFTFSMKVPRAVSHEAMLAGYESSFEAFLELLRMLADGGRLGPTFLQLGPSFSSQYWDRLRSFTERLPLDFPWAVEVRHRDWFDEGEHEEKLTHQLRGLGIDLVLFDSRPLFSRPPIDASEKEAQQRKPQSPCRTTITGRRPMLRLIGLNQVEPVLPWWEEWAEQVAQWLVAGLEPWIFTHAPDDTHAPKLARTFHAMVREKLAGKHPALPDPPSPPRREYSQLHLFDDG